jgi:hypothetical protein
MRACSVSVGIVKADAAEVDWQVILQRPHHHLENASQILPLANGSRDLVEQIETPHLSVEIFFQLRSPHDFGLQTLDCLGQILRSAPNPLVQFFVGVGENAPRPLLRERNLADEQRDCKKNDQPARIDTGEPKTMGHR